MALPAPFYQDALVTIYLGDCRDLLPNFGPATFDWCIMDPPERDGNPAIFDPLMAQVRPLVAACCNHVLELTHYVPNRQATGPNKGNLVSAACQFTIDGGAIQNATINDPDMKLAGWQAIQNPHAPASVLDPFVGAGGWILLAAKRAGIPSTGIGLDPNYLAQSAARIAAG